MITISAPSPIRKLCLAIATIGVLSASQGAWACEKPQVSGYDYVGCLKEGLSVVRNNDRMGLSKEAGFVDKTGKVVISLQYDYAGDFSEGLARVEKNGKYGYIDKTGKIVIALQYDYVSDFKNGQAQVSADDGKTPRNFYIDKTGKALIKRSSLAEFRKKLTQGDDVSYGGIKGMIFEIKGNLVQVQTTESQCTQRDYKGNCQNYVKNSVAKWVKRSEIYPSNHFD